MITILSRTRQVNRSRTNERRTRQPARALVLVVLFLILAALVAGWSSWAQAATGALISGEIERITITNRTDHWSGGTIQMAGQNVIIPRNILLDLPANRLTLKELFDQAPAACIATGETGLAKGDLCNTTGAGGFATIHANTTGAGNVIAGDVFIQKGIEAITGIITYISYTEGYFRISGNLNDPTTGVMVRLNDPDGRHTVQTGLGCAGGPNCSPDPRFTLDPDNYVSVFSSGYPLCIPSTVARPFPGLPAITGVAAIPAGSAQAAADGSGDVLCPQTNRPASGIVADSRRFAPIMVGDSINVEGNFETVGGVRFLSVHTTMVMTGLATRPAIDQPDYMFLDEVEIDMPAYQNERIRSLFIGYTTVAPADVLIWSLHYDPRTNSSHEFPLASSQGCDRADGVGTCAQTGLAANGMDIFKIRHDVDFLVGAKPKLSPCSHLRTDLRMGGTSICPGGDLETNTVDMLGILSPIPHEIQARTGKKFASLQPGGTPLIALDINGNETTWGQYLFPFGMGLGGLASVEPNEFDLNAISMPFYFSGLTWALDRRLSPAGCIDTTGDGIPDCEATPQPLDPFPFEGQDPRLQASVPSGVYRDTNFTASALSDSRNRILSFVDPALGKYNGNATLLAWPPVDPAFIPITPAVPVNLACTSAGVGGTVNQPPLALPDSAVASSGVAVAIPVLANDTDPDGDALSVTAAGPANNGAVLISATSVTYTSTAGFAGADSFLYAIADGRGGTSTSIVSVTVASATTNSPPVVVNDVATTAEDTPVDITVLANDTDPDPLHLGNLTVVAITQGLNGTVAINNLGTVNNSVRYTPRLNFSGNDSFTYTIADPIGGSASGTVTITVTSVNDAPVAVNDSTITNSGVAVTIAVLNNDTDVEGNPLTVTTTGPATNGAVVNNITSVTYTPNAGFSGADSFTYTISDGNGGTATATVTVTVNAVVVNSPPVAVNDTATTTVLLPVSIPVLTNDTDPNGNLLTVTAAGPATNGVVTNNFGSVTYAPNAGFAGTDSFTYTVSDGTLTATATVTVTVNAVTTSEITVIRAQFTQNRNAWRVDGTGTVNGNIITVHLGDTLSGPVIGTATVALGTWTVRVNNGVPLPAGTRTISVESSGGGQVLARPIDRVR